MVNQKLLIPAALLVASCDDSYTVKLTQDAPTSSGATGVTIPLHLKSDDAPGGVAFALSALPPTIVVSPATVTIDGHGNADAFALVPYGVSGTVLAAAAFATTASTAVTEAPLVLCPPTLTPADNGADLTVVGQVYTASVRALLSNTCAMGTDTAPAGVGITFVTSQASGSPTTTTVTTDATGTASANVIVPWGAAVFVQATGGGGTSTASVTGTSNPAKVACLSWKNQGGVYQVSTTVQNGATPLPGMPVAFSVISPSSSAAIVTPASAMTDGHGIASTVVAVASSAVFPVVVEAVSGNSSLTSSLDTGSSGGGCP